MSKYLALLLLLFIPFLILAVRFNPTNLNNLFTYSLCDEPIHYRVDIVDPKFNLSRDEFLSDINQAAQIWDEAIGKKLFVYDTESSLAVNLIYDERQFLTSQINQLENKVQADKKVLNPEVREFEKMALNFKQKLSDLNKEIESWNNKGGAPPDEYNKIIEKQKSLQAEADNLNVLARSLNTSTNAYNSQVDKLNQTIKSFNNALEQRPEEGLYKGPENKIEIYFNISKNELVHTLAHELGHALGLGHVSDPTAIMFSKTTQALTPSDGDIDVLNTLCQRHSIFELIIQKSRIPPTSVGG